MKSILSTLLFLITTLILSAQNLPQNPKAGKCYVSYITERNGLKKWKETNCDLIYKSKNLPISFAQETFEISEKDKKKIKKKITKLTDKGYTVEIKIYHDSQASDSVNFNSSKQKASVLLQFVNTLKLDAGNIIISPVGNKGVVNKCKPDDNNCESIYAKNTKVEYIVVGGYTDGWYYDNELGFWCKTK
ncbi:hypothetical protein [Lacinutrix salivirga]